MVSPSALSAVTPVPPGPVPVPGARLATFRFFGSRSRYWSSTGLLTLLALLVWVSIWLVMVVFSATTMVSTSPRRRARRSANMPTSLVTPSFQSEPLEMRVASRGSSTGVARRTETVASVSVTTAVWLRALWLYPGISAEALPRRSSSPALACEANSSAVAAAPSNRVI